MKYLGRIVFITGLVLAFSCLLLGPASENVYADDAKPTAGTTPGNDQEKPEMKVAPQENAKDDGEEVEIIEEVSVTSSDAGGNFLLKIFGRLHPAIVHVPIGWLMLLLLCDLAVLLGKREELRPASLYIHILTLLSFFPALFSGFINAGNNSTEADFLHLMGEHRNLIIAMALLTTIAFAIRCKAKNQLTGKAGYLYLGLIILATLLIGAAGHIGGKMVYGPDYLPF
jgi:uncharacterized membrane protein